MHLKKEFALGIGLVPLLMSACSNPVEFVHETIDPDATCHTAKDQKEATPLPAKLQDIRRSLGHTPLTQDFYQAVTHKKFTFCEGNLTDSSGYQYHADKNLLFVDADTAPEKIVAHELYKTMTAPASAQNWSAKLRPQEGLNFARILDAHTITAFISDLDDAYRYNPVILQNLKEIAEPDIRAIITAYEDSYAENSDKTAAMKETFNTALQIRMNDTQRDQEFLSWYAAQLRPRSVPTMSLCLDFQDGSMDPCIATKTIYPSPELGKRYLAPTTLMAISGSNHQGKPYLSSQDASETLLSLKGQAKNPGLQKAIAALDEDLTDCCDGSRNNSTFGYNISRGRFGISMF